MVMMEMIEMEAITHAVEMEADPHALHWNASRGGRSYMSSSSLVQWAYQKREREQKVKIE